MKPDEVDIESIDFQPINAGLGFHNSPTKNRPTKPARTITPRLKRTLRPKTKSKSIVLPTRSQPSPSLSRPAPLEMRFLGWLIDLALISALLALMLAGFWPALQLGPDAIMAMASKIDLAPFVIILFAVIYLAYFTYSDLDTSFGKRLLGLKLVSNKKRVLTCEMMLTRSLVTLLSLALIGLPSILDFQGKLSDSQVIKKN